MFVNSWETNNKRIIIETSDGTARLDATSPENTFEEGFWNFVAVTIDRINGDAHIYYNGEEVTESGAVVPGFQAIQSVTIGSSIRAPLSSMICLMPATFVSSFMISSVTAYEYCWRMTNRPAGFKSIGMAGMNAASP
ncbi:hypothetical protein EH223_10685 [candidate division KSB1 bacterium]|nr:hypothetical protein [candidate division KSB1 bacterium]RQW03220.1 MAG: hypothetical protein EH223_10685 [candidate division KSB1 bacterium]